ncbi:MAG: N-acetylmuramoyl-L-alanine amidase [Chromatiales bacterium]|jgi:N-acetylmuramoyl-L-alanine amidase|nr:N-acetylmuramoyl-L-alanine amidase [Chromatiales bacterium]
MSLLILALFAPIASAWSAATELRSMRTWTAPDNTRLVFDLSASAEYKLFRLSAPDRIVIDFKDTRMRTGITATTDGVVRGVRHAMRDRDLRVVLEVRGGMQLKHFMLSPNDEYGYRLVVDLIDGAATDKPVSAPTSPARTAKRSADEIVGVSKRPLVIAIDAGHGGEDPGARGATGLHEKDVVLAIARELEKLVAQDTGMKPVMIRDGDYFVTLRKRTLKARQHKADLFISIHADAYRDRSVRGGSLFVLSPHGATNEAARWLAERANASDLVGGVRLEDKDDVLASVLLDLSQDATLEASHVVADSILRQMGPIGKLHSTSVQQAGFVVLKSPDIPSVLVETAFISNPEDEAKLRNPRHQKVIAQAIYSGVREYFTRFPPAGTVYAVRRAHTIAQGDTLAQIAQQYRVSVERLRVANKLQNNSALRVGQVLQIPEG